MDGYPESITVTAEYQPKTGVKCSCKPGQQRDNCPNCEGTGMVIDFAAIRNRTKKRCNKCHRPMKGTTAYDGACECGGLIEATPTRASKKIESRIIWFEVFRNGEFVDDVFTESTLPLEEVKRGVMMDLIDSGEVPMAMAGDAFKMLDLRVKRELSPAETVQYQANRKNG